MRVMVELNAETEKTVDYIEIERVQEEEEEIREQEEGRLRQGWCAEGFTSVVLEANCPMIDCLQIETEGS